MSKIIILLAVTYSLVYAYSTPHFEQGTNVGPNVNDAQHILETDDVNGRSVDVKIQFEKPFYGRPQVAIASSVLEFEKDAPMGYSVKVASLSQQGFTARITALTQKRISVCQFNWFATDDPRINIQYAGLENLPGLGKGSGPRALKLTVPASTSWEGREDDDNVKVSAFINGFKIAAGEKAILKTSVEGYTNNAAKIYLATTGKTIVSGIDFCIIFANYENSYVSENVGETFDNTHEWSTKTGERLLKGEVNLPKDLKKGDLSGLVGITGFDSTIEGTKLRVQVNSFKLSEEKAEFNYGLCIWGDSKATLLTSALFAYVPDDFKVFSTECAELFTECNYKGKPVLLCDNINNLRDLAEQPVKSVHVPRGKAVKLYNRKDLQGKEVVFTQSQDCLQDIKFGF